MQNSNEIPYMKIKRDKSMNKVREPAANIWIRENLRAEIKRIAADEEITMRQLVSDILENWIEERKKKNRNTPSKPPSANPPKRTPDA